MAKPKETPAPAPERWNLRLAEDVRQRAQKIAEADRRRLSDVFRLAVEEGLAILEARLALQQKKR